MGLLTLYAGLLLPWIGGTLWLAFADFQFNKNRANKFRLFGYGFFLGYAVLFLAITGAQKLTGTTPWPGLMVFLLIFTVSGGIACWRSYTAPLPSLLVKPKPSKSRKVLAITMLVLMIVHLAFIGVEIFTQPVYPWDAWLGWIYRAKAWFMAGNMVGIVDKAAWTSATTPDIYTIDAWSYPRFASVVPLWAALSLGQWSETLINLPVLFVGLAIGMAIYGQSREHGLSAFASLVICYLLFSTPLFGTHMALAGYADIWMAGFTGLGFIALIRGIITRDAGSDSTFLVTMGLLMILFGAWVKNEGAVWFLAALAMLVLATCRPRVPILMIVAAILTVLLAFSLGITYVEIPFLGTFGTVNGRFVVPFIGHFTVEMHDFWQAYFISFVNMGSWNLLWVLLVASLFLGFRSPNVLSGYRARRTALSFILIFLATQVFIFGFTDQGLWADTHTAINRLPLHFLPALLFTIAVITNASLIKEGAPDDTMETQDGGH